MRLRVLVVDDTRSIRDVIARYMRILGHRKVDVASDGAIAWDWLCSGEEYDLVISDQGMPGMKGLELLERMKSDPHHKNTPFILASGNLSPLEKERCKSLGGIVLHKPVDLDRLIATLPQLEPREEEEEGKGEGE